MEAIRAALAAIQWPDDELSVFATLRGPLFAVGDEALLEWAHRFGPPRRRASVVTRCIPSACRRCSRTRRRKNRHLRPIADALALLKRLHRRRNYVPVSETLHELSARPARTSGSRCAPAASRCWRTRSTSRSSRVSSRRAAGSRSAASSRSARGGRERGGGGGPILEEDSDGVRMMTVHKAKGLEFPIVILADLTCKLARAEAGRSIDPDGALRVEARGWAPMDLLLDDAKIRPRLRGRRAARLRGGDPRAGRPGRSGRRRRDLRGRLAGSADARDLPALDARRNPRLSGLPPFPSKDTVLTRADGDPARPTTSRPACSSSRPASSSPLPASSFPLPASRVPSPNPPPPRDQITRCGLAELVFLTTGIPNPDKYQVVWWDPHSLMLQAPNVGGLRRDD